MLRQKPAQAAVVSQIYPRWKGNVDFSNRSCKEMRNKKTAHSHWPGSQAHKTQFEIFMKPNSQPTFAETLNPN